MFLAYHTAYAEVLGKPAVMLTKRDLPSPALRGATAKLVPALRFVDCDICDPSTLYSLGDLPVLGDEAMGIWLRPYITEVVDKLLAAMTSPLSENELNPTIIDNSKYVTMSVEGNLATVNQEFYKNGWTNGSPIIPPTIEAVQEMLTGTDLLPNHVVGYLPPIMMGRATVGKIAVNAVMAGCLPTHLPVLIAAVEGLCNTKLKLEGYTCSVATWAPMVTICGGG